MNQQSVDELLAQVQAQANEVSQTAAGSPDGAASMEIPGDMEPPAPKEPGPTLPGEFAPPPAVPPRPGDEAFTDEYRRLLAIEVPVIVQLGQRRMNVGEVMRMGVGAIIEFHKSADEDLDLLVNNKPIGRGHAVKVGENFGLKVSTIGSVRDTIRKLGGI